MLTSVLKRRQGREKYPMTFENPSSSPLLMTLVLTERYLPHRVHAVFVFN